MSLEPGDLKVYEELIRKDERIRILEDQKLELTNKYGASQEKLKMSKVEIARLRTFKESAERVQKFIANSVRAVILCSCTVHFLGTQFDSTLVSYNAEEQGVEFHLYGFNPSLSQLPVYAAFLSTVMVPYNALYKELDVKQIMAVASSVNPIKGKKKP
jgi:hypothetical protein